jgi:aspartyl-tRNA(Asn)/glutamyl-tRNA(Gln) amidotransferase subunit A
MRIGLPRKFFYEEMDAEVASAVEQALGVLKTYPASIQELAVEVPTDRTLLAAEAYAYHAEFIIRWPALYQPETLRRIRSGAEVSATDIAERRRELQQVRREIGAVFERVDVLVTPTTPIPAPSIAQLTQNPDLLRPQEIRLLRNTRPVNIWGLPAISVPCGFTQAGLPIGLQIIGPHWGEGNVFRLAHAYEQATAWHKRRPKLLDAG